MDHPTCPDHIEHAQRITVVEESIKTANHRIDELYENQKILLEMNGNIKLLAQQYQTQNKTLESVVTDIKELKERPAKRWDTLAAACLGALASGMVGAILALLFK